MIVQMKHNLTLVDACKDGLTLSLELCEES